MRLGQGPDRGRQKFSGTFLAPIEKASAMQTVLLSSAESIDFSDTAGSLFVGFVVAEAHVPLYQNIFGINEQCCLEKRNGLLVLFKMIADIAQVVVDFKMIRLDFPRNHEPS